MVHEIVFDTFKLHRNVFVEDVDFSQTEEIQIKALEAGFGRIQQPGDSLVFLQGDEFLGRGFYVQDGLLLLVEQQLVLLRNLKSERRVFNDIHIWGTNVGRLNGVGMERR